MKSVFIIDCLKSTMPEWVRLDSITGYEVCTEEDLQEKTNMFLLDIEEINEKEKRIMYEKFMIISPILSVATEKNKRSQLISKISEINNISKQTIRYYFCRYLIYQNITVLAPKQAVKEKRLSQDEKNMRWALNKFFYTHYKNSLKTAYTYLLQKKYCDKEGKLLENYPSFYQFRYFYRKTRKMQTYYISRDGLKDYQKNKRPLLGDNIQEYGSSIGMGMLDSTICDIYLIDESGKIIGRPILTACIDTYSSLCCGYCLTLEGGVYSLEKLMLNIITDKQKWCKQFGIFINKEDWNCNKLPSIFVTDRGKEYESEIFSQITELGTTIVNLPSYRPELKGSVEKFFDLLQKSYKKYLKGKGVIEPDFQERGARDYRKDACLTINDFEKIILNCIIYYNSKRIVNFPYTKEMVESNVQPFANAIWEWGLSQTQDTLITTTEEQIAFTFLPRTKGTFTRSGLKVNKLRYKNENFTEKFLSGGEVIVAYNPQNVSFVWLIDSGKYIKFELIETRFKNETLMEVQKTQNAKRKIIKEAEEENIQAQIDLSKKIQNIVSTRKMINK